MGLSTHACLWRDVAPTDGAAALGGAVVPAQRGRVRKVMICGSAVEVVTDFAWFGYGCTTSKARASFAQASAVGAAGVVANPGLVSGSGTPSSNTGMQFILLFVFYPLPASPGGGGAEFPGSLRRFLTAVQEAERFFWGPCC